MRHTMKRMARRWALWLVGGCLLVGCHHRMPAETAATQPAPLPAGSEWEVTGIGISPNHQASIAKARAKALDGVMDSLRGLVAGVAAHNRFCGVRPPDSLAIEGYRTAGRRMTTFNNERGERMYKCYYTVSLPSEPLYRAAYGQAGFPPAYGYDQFLRDIGTIQSNQNHNQP